MARPGVVFTPPALADELAHGLELRRTSDAAPRVLDPACGDGALLGAWLERHANDVGLARHAVFGIELDPELAERARERLRAQVGLPRGTELDDHIVCADALAEEASWPAATHVLANPPWVSFSGKRAAPSEAPQAVARLAGWPSLHGAFLERIARHVAEQRTRARLIVPAQVVELAGYGPVREAVTALARVSEPPRELGEDRFAGVIGASAIVTLEPHSNEPAPEPSPQPWTTVRCEGPEAPLLEALDAFPRLPPKTFADPGVHTGNAARELVVETGGAGRVPVRVGRDLSPYRLGRATRYLRTDLERTPERRFRIAARAHYESFPILLRQTADRPQAALHLEPGYFRNSLLAAREVQGLDPAFVVGVLNGPVATVWHRTRWRDARQRSFPQVKVAHLASQPFPFLERSARPALHDELANTVHELASSTAPDTRAFADARRRAFELALSAFDLPGELNAVALSAAMPDRPTPDATTRPPRSAR